MLGVVLLLQLPCTTAHHLSICTLLLMLPSAATAAARGGCSRGWRRRTARSPPRKSEPHAHAGAQHSRTSAHA